MNETMLALLGFATIITIIVLLLRNVTVPALAFIGVSTVTAVILTATGTFTVSEMGEFITAGVSGVHSTAALFIFSVLFFGIMTDADSAYADRGNHHRSGNGVHLGKY